MVLSGSVSCRSPHRRSSRSNPTRTGQSLAGRSRDLGWPVQAGRPGSNRSRGAADGGLSKAARPRVQALTGARRASGAAGGEDSRRAADCGLANYGEPQTAAWQPPSRPPATGPSVADRPQTQTAPRTPGDSDTGGLAGPVPAPARARPAHNRRARARPDGAAAVAGSRSVPAGACLRRGRWGKCAVRSKDADARRRRPRLVRGRRDAATAPPDPSGRDERFCRWALRESAAT